MISIRMSSSESSLRIQENMTPKKKQKTSNVRCEDEDKAAASAEALNDSATDWRDKFKHIRDMYLDALEKKHLTDVIFIVGEDKVSFSAHRVILAIGSPVFEAMFFGGLAEKGDSVSIPDVDSKGFEYLLRYLYCGDVVFDNDVIAFKTFFAADKYCVMSLKDLCENYLTKCKLKASNVWVFLESSLFLNSHNIKDRCLAFLRLSTKSALEDNSFLDVTTKTVETFLSLDSLGVCEMRLLLHLVRWAEHKSQMELDPDSSFHNFFMPLLKLVRFYNLTYKDFVLVLEMPKLKNVFSDSDALAILKYIINPAVCSLPDWCCKKIRHNTSDTAELDRSNSLRGLKNEKQDDSSPWVNRNKRKRGLKIKMYSASSTSSDSSDSSDTGTEIISSSSSVSSSSSAPYSDIHSILIEPYEEGVF